MSITITSTEAARRFSDLLNRIRYRRESFVILRNGQEVAELRPSERSTVSFGDLLSGLTAMATGDPSFADDLEAIRSEQPEVPESPWDS